MLRNHKLVKIVLGGVLKLPTPVNISYWWNWGSMVGLLLVGQLLSGLLMTMHYVPEMDSAFLSVVHLQRDVEYGWVLRFFHANGASFFLFGLFMHVGRGLYYKSFLSLHVWFVGVLLLMLSMLVAFFGYVLPWGQMSFWGATVITNMLSAIPVYGNSIVFWVWGGFSVGAPTLTRFYTFHFVFPFVLVFLSLIHLFFLHEAGSSNPVKVNSVGFKISFWPYFGVKDVLGFMVVFAFLVFFVGFMPDSLGDPENYIEANSLVTPVHIKPEWYFLFAYAILRCIPNKTMGVLALVLSLLSLGLVPLLCLVFGLKKKGTFYNILFWVWAVNFLILTWLGGSPVEEPFIYLAQVSSVFYFMLLFFMSLV
uniref:Cytochrome b n=1 Tax=Halocynthia spinosa TaxID=569430 RepID=S0DG86_HALSF|nr:cytochrome b [Halocynthia spinosa]CCO25767.1 cytochrome b [Halocynthia spinosa]